MSSEGTISIPFADTQARSVVAELKARCIEAVGVCFLWSLVLLLLSGPAAKTAPTSDGCQPGGCVPEHRHIQLLQSDEIIFDS
jgi:hypothetical protein